METPRNRLTARYALAAVSSPGVQIQTRTGGSRQEGGIKPPAGPGQHKEEKSTRSQKSFDGMTVLVPDTDSGKAGDDTRRHDKREWGVVVVLEGLRAHCDGGYEADEGKSQESIPERIDDAARTEFDVARELNGEPKGSVHGKGDQGDKSADDGVPVQD